MIPREPKGDFFQPTDLPSALKALTEAPGYWTPLAGGTDLMVRLRSEPFPKKAFMDLSAIEAFKTLEIGSTHLKIGALCTYQRLRHFLCSHQIFPNLKEACRLTGSPAIQNRGTLGGNIVNASPSADSVPALLSYDAEIELISTSAVRRISLDRFYQGYKQMDLQANELLSAIYLPLKPNAPSELHFYRKVGTRQAQAISKLCAAIHLQKQAGRITHARIALGAVAPNCLRAKATEAHLMGAELATLSMGEVRRCLISDIAPISDLRSTERYRRMVSGNLLIELLKTFTAD